MNNIPQQTHVVVNGIPWYLFSAQYETPDGTYEFYFYAISFYHAEIVLQDIKSTARVAGQVLGAYTA